MKIRSAFQILLKEYEVFSHLSFGLRSKAAGALILLYFSLVFITHLAFYPYLADTTKADGVILIIYLFVLVIALLTILPILFPRLQQHSSLAMLLIIALNSFPFLLVVMLVPRLRRYMSAIISTLVFISVSVAGIIIWAEGIERGILEYLPGPVPIVLWGAGLVAVFLGIFIYGYVTETISVEKTSIEAEIRIGHEIQSQLVPPTDFTTATYEVFGNTLPAYQIGGDFFEVLPRPGEELIVSVGDVSGHNIAAGLIMAITRGAFQAALHHTSSMTSLMETINGTLFDNTDKRMYVTMKCMLFDFEKGNATMVNAGHLPVLHYRQADRQIVSYNPPGLALGIRRRTRYTSEAISFEPGDLFLFLTDGLVEVMNSGGEQFGMERIIDSISSRCNQGPISPKGLYTELMDSVSSFSDNRDLEDDTTYLAIKIADR